MEATRLFYRRLLLRFVFYYRHASVDRIVPRPLVVAISSKHDERRWRNSEFRVINVESVLGAPFLRRVSSYVRRSDARLIGLMSSRYPFVGIAKSCTGAERATAGELWSLTAGITVVIGSAHVVIHWNVHRAASVRDLSFSDFTRGSFESFHRATWQTYN